MTGASLVIEDTPQQTIILPIAFALTKRSSTPALTSRIAALEAELGDSEDISDDADEDGEDVYGHEESSRADVAAGASRGKRRKTDAAVEATDADLPLHCEACNISVTSQELMREHLQGRKHVAAVRLQAARAESRYCDICALEFTGETQLTEHLKGRKHKVAAAKRVCLPAQTKAAGATGAGSSSSTGAQLQAANQMVAVPTHGKSKAPKKKKQSWIATVMSRGRQAE